MNTQLEKMTANDLFLIKNALHLLAEKTQKELMNGDALANRVFDEIVELEKYFVISYYEAKGMN